MLKQAVLMICIATMALPGCLVSGESLSGDTVITFHTIHDGEDGTMDGTLRVVMRTQPTPATNAALTSDGAAALDPGGVGLGTLARGCLSDDEGHPICCEIDSANRPCCVHEAPDGSTRVCL
jgi:hypothetical protein